MFSESLETDPSSHTGSAYSKPTATTQATSLNDGSVSKLSDNTSRLLEFEDKFNQVTNDLRQCSKQQEQTQLENKQMLTAIMDALEAYNGIPDPTFVSDL